METCSVSGRAVSAPIWETSRRTKVLSMATAQARMPRAARRRKGVIPRASPRWRPETTFASRSSTPSTPKGEVTFLG